MSINVNGASGVSGINLSGMDVETAMLAVQSQRASLLEGQLSAQLEGVQNRNSNIAGMNDQLNTLRTDLADLETQISNTDPKNTDDLNALKSQKSALQANIDNLKTKIDTESNSQQMDMLRLQGLSNKRNEAFDLMTNFVKKMQDSRSSIVGNMR